MLFGGGLLAVFGSEIIGYEGAGPLAVVFAAFTSSYYWCKQGWELEDNPVATAFEIFWMVFEPILFGITGATVKVFNINIMTFPIVDKIDIKKIIDKGTRPRNCDNRSWM